MRRLVRPKKARDGLTDDLGPKGDTVQLILKRRGVAEAAIYKDDKQEIRSPSLQQDNDESTDHNS
jgi:hypothetical protein